MSNVMSSLTFVGVFVLVLTAIGCKTEVEPMASTKINKTASVVIVGVGNGFAGKCSGTDKDISKMKTLLKPYASSLVSLKDKQATKKAVLDALTSAVKNVDHSIFYFTGHGTHTAATTDKGEVDGQDEYICCYDTVVSDNEIWGIISKARGRVLLIFDCCHSGTMYRAPITFSRQIQQARATSKVDGPISMICWSGCPDNKYSWGTSAGGYMTSALKSSYKKTRTYDEVWKKMEADKTTKKYEVIQQTKMGRDFGASKVFQ